MEPCVGPARVSDGLSPEWLPGSTLCTRLRHYVLHFQPLAPAARWGKASDLRLASIALCPCCCCCSCSRGHLSWGCAARRLFLHWLGGLQFPCSTGSTSKAAVAAAVFAGQAVVPLQHWLDGHTCSAPCLYLKCLQRACLICRCLLRCRCHLRICVPGLWQFPCSAPACALWRAWLQLMSSCQWHPHFAAQLQLLCSARLL
jgi:hypothetical protein